MKAEIESGRCSGIRGKGFLICRNDSSIASVKHSMVTFFKKNEKVTALRFMSFKDHDRECFAKLTDCLSESRLERLRNLEAEEKAAKQLPLPVVLKLLSLRTLRNGDIESGITNVKAALVLDNRVFNNEMVIEVKCQDQRYSLQFKKTFAIH